MEKLNTCHTQAFSEAWYIKEACVCENRENSKFLMCDREMRKQNTHHTQACDETR